MRSDMRAIVDDLCASLLRILIYFCGIGALALVAAESLSTLNRAAATDAARYPEWIDVARPQPAFATAGLVSVEPRYAILRHTQGGGRKDLLSFGEFGAATPSGLISIYRPGAERELLINPEIRIAPRTADFRLAGGVALAETLDTKFGKFDLVDFAAKPSGALRRCVGFARTFEEPPLQIAGWYCNGGPEIVDRGALACMLDGLTVVSAGSDPRLAASFARAEIKRTFCGRNDPILAATPKYDDWLVAAKDPKLRGRLAGR